jgi:predicted RNase H-like HicB family nuclease
MKNYIGLLDTADGMFGVSFPDAPGCAAMASTEQSVIDEASLALLEWIADEARDGRPTPPPRSAADIGRHHDIAAALEGGARLISVELAAG